MPLRRLIPPPRSIAVLLTLIGAAALGSRLGALRFAARAERARRDELLLFASDYRQPFGGVTGTLPGGVELASGSGVMERHHARW